MLNIDGNILRTLAVAFAAASLGVAGSAGAQDLEPPAPNDAATELELPDPVGRGELPAVQSLPPVPLAFHLSIAGQAALPPWEVSGTVAEVGKNSLALDVGGEQAVLLFRLPNEQPLNVDEQEQVMVMRPRFLGQSQGRGSYGVDVLREDGLVFSAARVFGRAPAQVETAGGALVVEQIDDRGDRRSATKYESVYNAPATVRGAEQDNRVPLVEGQRVPIVVNDRSYLVELVSSVEAVPTEEAAETAEGAGYALEFSVREGVLAPEKDAE